MVLKMDLRMYIMVSNLNDNYYNDNNFNDNNRKEYL